MTPSVSKKIVCWICKQPITGARTVIGGFWYCADCTYKYDHPGKVVASPKKPRKAKATPPKLFDIPPKGHNE